MALPLELELKVHQLVTAQLLTQLHEELKTKVELAEPKSCRGLLVLLFSRWRRYKIQPYDSYPCDLMWGIGTDPDYVYSSEIGVLNITDQSPNVLYCKYKHCLLRHWQTGGKKLYYRNIPDCRASVKKKTDFFCFEEEDFEEDVVY